MRSKAIIKTSVLILSIILLSAVIASGYGYYKNSSFIIYAALTIIFIVSLMLPLQNTLDKGDKIYRQGKVKSRCAENYIIEIR